jgi:putative ribosome biogenesis GTPase RsgA
VNPTETLVILTRGLHFSTQSKRAQKQQNYQQLFTHFQQTLLTGNEAQIAELYDSSKKRRSQRRLASLRPYVANIDVRDLTIVMNPALPVTNQNTVSRFLVMKAQFGSQNEHQLTLYWRELENGEWRIATQVWNNPNT